MKERRKIVEEKRMKLQYMGIERWRKKVIHEKRKIETHKTIVTHTVREEDTHTDLE